MDWLIRKFFSSKDLISIVINWLVSKAVVVSGSEDGCLIFFQEFWSLVNRRLPAGSIECIYFCVKVRGFNPRQPQILIFFVSAIVRKVVRSNISLQF